MEKEGFLRLLVLLHNTGLANAINRVDNSKDLKNLWKAFLDTNRTFIAKAKKWERERQPGFLFETFEEKIPYPTEIFCILKILGIKEEEIFEDPDDFQMSLKRENKPFSTAVAYLMKDKSVLDITAEDFFVK